MNIDKLHTFKILCETMSFTKTAEILYTSQPNVTKQIQSLEKELGYPLIHRIHKNFTLTKYGQLFYHTSNQIITEFENGLNSLQEHANHMNHTIIIGATPFIGSKILPQLLPLIKEKFPNYQVSIKVDRSKNILSDLESHKIQLAFFSEYIPIDRNHFKEKNLYKDDLVVISSPTHPLAAKGYCTLKELDKEIYISKGKSSSLHRFLFQQLGEPSFMKRQVFVVDNQYSIKEAVAQGLGISIVSELLVKKDLENHILEKIQIENYHPQRNIKVVYRKNYDESIIHCIENLMQKTTIK